MDTMMEDVNVACVVHQLGLLCATSVKVLVK